ncbi:DUF1798 family protein [Sporolactobacillus sp. THM7-4]|nr:DUF1798 family protein [Sporolactobacillus sp. THM7-4]
MGARDDFRLRQLTAELRKANRDAHDQFVNRTLQDDYETDFYGEVKPFADKMQRLIDEWRPLATGWVIRRKPKYVYPIQIKDTCDNLSIVCVTAFQKDTRRRRFFETIKSIDYVLENMLDQLDPDDL